MHDVGGSVSGPTGIQQTNAPLDEPRFPGTSGWRAAALLGSYFFRLLDGLPAGAYTCDNDGLITYYNRRAIEIWGREPTLNDPVDRFCGSFRLFTPTGTPLMHDECWMALALLNRCSFDGEEIVIERPDGKRIPVLAYANPLADESGTPIGAVNVLVDISELKGTHDLLEKANRVKDEFLATLSHELRNPLAPIRNSLEMLHRTPVTATQRAAIDIVDRQVMHLTRLVDELLDSARISSGKFALRHAPTDLAAAVRIGIETSLPLVDAAGVRFSFDLPSEPLIVDGDDARLVQVVANLLNNAAKYTPRGGTIALNLTSDGTEAVMTVRDTGVGITPDMLEHIFGMFERGAVASRRARDGLGIGLSLARHVVELHGGAITADSGGAGCGSTFTVRVPLGASQSASAIRPIVVGGRVLLRDGPRATVRRVLVVDDSRDATESARALLELLGHEVQTANDGATALRLAHTFRPDAVLLDIGLPDIDGYAVARALRAQHWSNGVLLVAVTGWGHESDRVRSREAGFDHHLVKPVDFSALADMLNTMTPND